MKPLYEAHFSAAKLIFFEVVLGIGAIVPMLPGVETGLVWTAAFFTPALAPVRWVCCAILGLLALWLLPYTLRAIAGAPALVITDDAVEVLDPLRRTFQRGAITGVGAVDQFGTIPLRLADGRKRAFIRTGLYRRPKEAAGEILSVLGRP